MVLLYVVLSNVCPCEVEEIFDDVNKSLEIFKSMHMLAVSRSCSNIISDLLDTARQAHADRGVNDNREREGEFQLGQKALGRDLRDKWKY